MSKLTVAKLRALRKPGRYGDGGTLYFNVAPGGSKFFVQRLTVDGRRCELGLGGWPVTSLADAWAKALENRRLVAAGGNPLEEKRKARVPTFREAAQGWLDTHRGEWTPGHARDLGRSFEAHVFEKIGARPVDRITPQEVLDVLLPLFESHRTLGRRMRIRIRSVFSWCLSHGFVQQNVAGDVIADALPGKRPPEESFRALPHSEISQVYHRIAASGGAPQVRLCLQLIILTAVRGHEAREAVWGDIDIPNRLWRIPAAKTKTRRRDHEQPLSSAALNVLGQAQFLSDGSDCVFPSLRKPGAVLNATALRDVLVRIGVIDRMTVHGCRATFRTWADECAKAPFVEKELSLGHSAGSSLVDAYARFDYLEPRRRLMEKWGSYVFGPPVR